MFKLKYPTWLKRLLLPFEFEDHPLHVEMVQRDKYEQQLEAEEQEIWKDI